MTISKENITEEQVKDNLETGVIMAIQEHVKTLDSQLLDLSKKELIRLAKNAARFPAPLPTVGQKELDATTTLYAIKDLQVEMAIISIGRMQEEQEKESEETTSK